MSALTARQQSQVLAFANHKKSSRAIVVQFEKTLQEYWDKDRQSPHNISFMLTEASKRFPRIQQAMRKLIVKYAPLVLHKGKWINNPEKVSSRTKAKLKGELSKLITMMLPSMLSHPDIKVVIEYKWAGSKDKVLANLIQVAIDNGVSEQELRTTFDKSLAKAAKLTGDKVVSIVS